MNDSLKFLSLRCHRCKLTHTIGEVKARNMLIACPCGRIYFLAVVESVSQKEDLIKQLEELP